MIMLMKKAYFMMVISQIPHLAGIVMILPIPKQGKYVKYQKRDIVSPKIP